MIHTGRISTRIFAGFGLVLAVAIVIFLVAFFAIGKINGNIEKITESSLPMVETGADLTTSLLKAEIEVIEMVAAKSQTNFDKHQERFQKYSVENSNTLKVLKGYMVEVPQLKGRFDQAASAKDSFFNAARQAQDNKSSALISEIQMREQASEFTDMADEILSYSYDLESVVSSDTSVAAMAEFIERLELSVESANGAIESSIRPEVLGVRSELQSDVADLKSQLSALGRASDVRGSSEINNMQEVFTRFESALIGSSSVINAKLASLKAIGEAKDQLVTAQKAAVEAIDTLESLNAGISDLAQTLKGEAQASVTASKTIITLTTLIALASACFIAFRVTASIREPLRDIGENIQKLSGGDLSATFTKHRDDELGELSDHMQTLASSLNSVIREITANTEQLAATAEQTTTISQQSSQNVYRQKEQSEMMATSITEMTSTVESVAASITHTQEQVQGAHERIVSGEKLLADNIRNIEHLAEETEIAAGVIERLNDDTTNISAVLDVIRSVAEQTNLLALNAAIEAARAGEQGRGFAVVADEVRTLASRTHNSTAEIQELIERLLDGSGKAVSVMSKSQQETSECVTGIQEVGRMLSALTQSITNINDMSQQIASAAEEQSVAANTQNQSIIEITHIAEQTANSAQENQVASEELARMAEAQMALVQRFKL